MGKSKLSVSLIKQMGKESSNENLEKLKGYYQDKSLPIDIRREIVSSIGRQKNLDAVFEFISVEAFSGQPMDLVYQMYRTCLKRSEKESRFYDLGNKIKFSYNNEVINKMYDFYQYRKSGKKHIVNNSIIKPLLLCGDSLKTLETLSENSIQLIFTSPPYYNAREYSDYTSYDEYLKVMKKIFQKAHRVLELGRYFIINVSPVITKRPGREFESTRYPIHYDFHSILKEIGFDFIDEIYWIKPEASVPSRVGRYTYSRRPLGYKPNCITESIMVYRKRASFVVDENQARYKTFDKFEDKEIDTSNCWYISPKSDKDHPAVFPEELCQKILRYYSYEQDVVMDIFAGSGTFGRAALKMNRIPVLCERNKDYIEIILNRSPKCFEICKIY